MVALAKEIRFLMAVTVDDDGSGGCGRCATCEELIRFGELAYILSDSKTGHMGYENNREHCGYRCIIARAKRKGWEVWVADGEIPK